MRAWTTILVWGLHIACVLAAASIAGLLAFIVTSLDPVQIVNAGVEPWTDALWAAAAFLAVAFASAISLRLWHTSRLRAVSAIILAAEIIAIVWAAVAIYGEYT